MQIGQRLRELRAAKNLSQGDIERRTGLLRCYTSRVENDHTVPSIETLTKYARALDLPLHEFFCNGDEAPKKSNPLSNEIAERVWGANRKESFELLSLAKALSRMDGRKRKLLLGLAHRMTQRKREGVNAGG
jgi:transcriptional regulator with XRE-family HTH domain